MKFLPKYPRRFALDCLYRFVDTKLWVNLQHQVHMIWHDFHFDDVKVIFVSNGMYELLQSHVHAIHEYFSTILGAEYNMIFTRIHDIVV